MQAIYKIFEILKNGSKHSLNEMKGVRSIHAFISKKGAFMPPTNTNLTVLFNQMNLTGFWNVLFLHEKGFWNDHLKCKVHIYFDACPAMPHAIVFRENSRTCRKIQRNLLWFKRNHFQDSSMDTHRPVSSLTTHPIYCVYHAKSIFFLCKHRPGLDAKFKISKLSHRMCAAHAWNIKSRRNKKLIA